MIDFNTLDGIFYSNGLAVYAYRLTAKTECCIATRQNSEHDNFAATSKSGIDFIPPRVGHQWAKRTGTVRNGRGCRSSV